MKQILDYPAMEEGAYKRSIILLYQKLIKQLSPYFSTQQIGVVRHSYFVEVVFSMNDQQMLENFVSDLADKLHIHVLYASREDNGRVYKVVAYSTPVEDEMFVLHLSSTNYGIVDSMTVFFFDSLETMYYQLLAERNRMSKRQGDILEQEDYVETLSNFN
uniref:Uncharacterized protein n=1 Tax=Prevotella sp. GTC17254 TaxID=3236794 RepID=A0AB33IZM8_9BACT